MSDRSANPSGRIPDLAEALTELTRLMLSTPTLEDLLGDLARLAAKAVSPPAACAITLRTNDQSHTVAASDALASQVEEVQYGHDDGPCLEAMRTGEIITVDDMGDESRWGSYRGHVLGYGIRSCLCLPLSVDGDNRGALNLYSTDANAFGAADVDRASLFAAQGAAALTLVIRQSRQVELSEQLREALAARAVIDQAVGILMAQQRCDAATAFGQLRMTSQNRNQKLRDVAVEIVQAVSGEPHRTTPFNEPE